MQMMSLRSPRDLNNPLTPSRLSSGRDRPPVANVLPTSEDVKDLPPEEFQDFLSTYDKEVDSGEGSYPSLDDALKEDIMKKLNESNFSSIISISFYFDIKTQKC